MGPQDPKDVVRDMARDISALVKELAAFEKGDANIALLSLSTQPYGTVWIAHTRAAMRSPGKRFECPGGAFAGNEDQTVENAPVVA